MEPCKMVFQFLCLYLAFLVPVLCSYYQHQKNLLQTLTDSSRYNRKIVPMEDMDSPIPIDAVISIGDYIEVHEDTQSVLLDIWLTFFWRDYLLTWNISEYGNINLLRMDLDDIWHPDIKINFGTDHGDIIDESSQVAVSSNGDVSVHLIDSTSVRCFLDVTKFPFDKQTCEMYILPLNAVKTEAYFKNVSTNVKVVGEGQWDILSHGSSFMEKSNITFIVFEFVIERRPSFYVTYVMLPIFATSLLNPVVFLIPADSGEKISTAVTILLSYSVFLGVISDVLSKTSTSIAMVSIYIVGSQVLSGAYVLICVIIVRIDKKLDLDDRIFSRLPGVKNRVDDKETKNPPEIKFNEGRWDRICARVSFTFILILTISLIIFIRV